MLGYWEDKEKTDACIEASGWFHSGWVLYDIKGSCFLICDMAFSIEKDKRYRNIILLDVVTVVVDVFPTSPHGEIA